MSVQIDDHYVIEPFDPVYHDREGFRCGVSAVDNYFRKTANKLAKADNARVFVMVAPDGAVAGFYALNAHAVWYEELPPSFARSRPSHGKIPAAFISMIGRDRRFTGQGLGGDLLVDALTRVAKASDVIGISVIMLDVLDCGDVDRVQRRKALYEGYGFQPLPSNPLRLFLPVATVRQMLAELSRLVKG